jgi:Cu+-exporting ATPase
VALSSASFVLVSSDLSGILTLVDLSATVFRRVKLNFVRVDSKRCDRG